MEQGAITNFLAAPGPLKTGLEKFTAELARQQKSLCTDCMASVPRDPERAADHAAKAQLLDQFWDRLTDELISFARTLEEPTLQDRRSIVEE